MAAPVTATLLVVACGTTPSGRDSANQDTEVSVLGLGQVVVVPDAITVEVTIDSTAPNVTTALNSIAQQQRILNDRLLAASVDATDISTAPPVLDQSAEFQIHAAQNIEAAIRGLDKTAGLLNAVSGTAPRPDTTTRVTSIAYSLADGTAAVRDATERALRNAHDTAQNWATMTGKQLGRILSASPVRQHADDIAQNLVARPRGTLPAELPLAKGEQTLQFVVTCDWQLQ